MPRRLYNIAVVTSLVLFVVVMGLWVESGFRMTVIPLTDTKGDKILIVAQGHGAMTLGWIVYWHFADSGLQIRNLAHFSMIPSELNATTWLGIGFERGRGGNLIIIPHWLLTILTAILPVIWLIRRRRKPDPDAVPCAKCGYDLRESRDACPECGEPIPTSG